MYVFFLLSVQQLFHSLYYELCFSGFSWSVLISSQSTTKILYFTAQMLSQRLTPSELHPQFGVAETLTGEGWWRTIRSDRRAEGIIIPLMECYFIGPFCTQYFPFCFSAILWHGQVSLPNRLLSCCLDLLTITLWPK